MNETMKAVILYGDKDLRVGTIEQGVLADDKCRIKVMNVGVCSSDIYRAFGGEAYFYPLIMGHELSGKVVETGKNISRFNVGDKVVVFPLMPCFECNACTREQYQQCSNYKYHGSRSHGGYAEYLDVNEWNLLPLPDKISFADAAAIEPLSVALHAVKRLRLFESNQEISMLILGAGFLGLLMAQIIKNKLPHIKLTIIDPNDFKLSIAKQYVNETILLNSAFAWSDYLENNGKNSFDIVVEATGVPALYEYSIQLAKPSATLLWMGNITGDLQISKKSASSILRKELTLLGTWNSTYHPEKESDWKLAIQLIEEGIHPSQLVTHWISLDETPEILKKLHAHKSRTERFESIKVMIANHNEDELTI